jgi:tRNA-dihydrouridine synthase
MRKTKFFGGIDTFYAYIFERKKMVIKSSISVIYYQRTINTLKLFHKLLNDADEFLFCIKICSELGYKELNWNLGCPYPMVTKCGMGSGLISNTEKINKFLRKYMRIRYYVSMKMRLGYDTTEEILDVSYFRKIPIKECCHTCIGKQLYKGGVHLDAFQACVDNTSLNCITTVILLR